MKPWEMFQQASSTTTTPVAAEPTKDKAPPAAKPWEKFAAEKTAAPAAPPWEQFAANTYTKTQGQLDAKAQRDQTKLETEPQATAWEPDGEPGQLVMLNGYRKLSKDALANLDGGKELLSIVDKNSRGRKGFMESLFTLDKGMLPFVGSVAEGAVAIKNLKGVRESIRKMEAGEPLTDQELVYFQLMLSEDERRAQETWKGTAGDLIRMLPTYAIEFASVAGAVSRVAGLTAKGATVGGTAAINAAGRKAVSGWLAKAVSAEGTELGKAFARDLAEKSFGKQLSHQLGAAAVKGVAITTALKGVHAIANAAQGVDPLDTSRSVRREIYADLAGDEEALAAAKWDSLGSYAVEWFSEASGAALGTVGGQAAKLAGKAVRGIPLSDVGGKAIRDMLSRIQPASVGAAGEASRDIKTVLAGMTFSRMMQKLNLDPDQTAIWMRRAGWNGWLEEMGEERLGGFVNGLLGFEGDRDDAALARAWDQMGWEDLDQFKAEAVAFAVPGLTHAALLRAQASKAFGGPGGTTVANALSKLYRSNRASAAAVGLTDIAPEAQQGEDSLMSIEETVEQVKQASGPISQLIDAENKSVFPKWVTSTLNFVGRSAMAAATLSLDPIRMHSLDYLAALHELPQFFAARRESYKLGMRLFKGDTVKAEALADDAVRRMAAEKMRMATVEKQDVDTILSRPEYKDFTKPELARALRDAAADPETGLIEVEHGTGDKFYLRRSVTPREDGTVQVDIAGLDRDKRLRYAATELLAKAAGRNLLGNTLAVNAPANNQEAEENAIADARGIMGVANEVTELSDPARIKELRDNPTSVDSLRLMTVLGFDPLTGGLDEFNAFLDNVEGVRSLSSKGKQWQSKSSKARDAGISVYSFTDRQDATKINVVVPDGMIERAEATGNVALAAELRTAANIRTERELEALWTGGQEIRPALRVVDGIGIVTDNPYVLAMMLPDHFGGAANVKAVRAQGGMKAVEELVNTKLPRARLPGEKKRWQLRTNALNNLFEIHVDAKGRFFSIGAQEDWIEQELKRAGLYKRSLATQAFLSHFYEAVDKLYPELPEDKHLLTPEELQELPAKEKERREVRDFVRTLQLQPGDGAERNMEAPVHLFQFLALGNMLIDDRRLAAGAALYKKLLSKVSLDEKLTDKFLFSLSKDLGLVDSVGNLTDPSIWRPGALLHASMSPADAVTVMKRAKDRSWSVDKDTAVTTEPEASLPTLSSVLNKLAPEGTGLDVLAPEEFKLYKEHKAAIDSGIAARRAKKKEEPKPVPAKEEPKQEAPKPTPAVTLDIVAQEARMVELQALTGGVTRTGTGNDVTYVDAASGEALERVSAVIDRHPKFKGVPKPKTSRSADAGTLIHAKLAAFLTAGGKPLSKQWSRIADYFKSAGWTLLPEVTLRHKTLGFAGTIDYVAVSPTGAVYLIDAKTMASGGPFEAEAGNKFFRENSQGGTDQLHHELQLNAYKLIVESYGIPVSGLFLLPLAQSKSAAPLAPENQSPLSPVKDTAAEEFLQNAFFQGAVQEAPTVTPRVAISDKDMLEASAEDSEFDKIAENAQRPTPTDTIKPAPGDGGPINASLADTLPLDLYDQLRFYQMHKLAPPPDDEGLKQYLKNLATLLSDGMYGRLTPDQVLHELARAQAFINLTQGESVDRNKDAEFVAASKGAVALEAEKNRLLQQMGAARSKGDLSAVPALWAEYRKRLAESRALVEANPAGMAMATGSEATEIALDPRIQELLTLTSDTAGDNSDAPLTDTDETGAPGTSYSKSNAERTWDELRYDEAVKRAQNMLRPYYDQETAVRILMRMPEVPGMFNPLGDVAALRNEETFKSWSRLPPQTSDETLLMLHTIAALLGYKDTFSVMEKMTNLKIDTSVIIVKRTNDDGNEIVELKRLLGSENELKMYPYIGRLQAQLMNVSARTTIYKHLNVINTLVSWRDPAALAQANPEVVSKFMGAFSMANAPSRKQIHILLKAMFGPLPIWNRLATMPNDLPAAHYTELTEMAMQLVAKIDALIADPAAGFAGAVAQWDAARMDPALAGTEELDLYYNEVQSKAYQSALTLTAVEKNEDGTVDPELSQFYTFVSMINAEGAITDVENALRVRGSNGELVSMLTRRSQDDKSFAAAGLTLVTVPFIELDSRVYDTGDLTKHLDALDYVMSEQWRLGVNEDKFVYLIHPGSGSSKQGVLLSKRAFGLNPAAPWDAVAPQLSQRIEQIKLPDAEGLSETKAVKRRNSMSTGQSEGLPGFLTPFEVFVIKKTAAQGEPVNGNLTVTSGLWHQVSRAMNLSSDFLKGHSIHPEHRYMLKSLMTWTDHEDTDNHSLEAAVLRSVAPMGIFGVTDEGTLKLGGKERGMDVKDIQADVSITIKDRNGNDITVTGYRFTIHPEAVLRSTVLGEQHEHRASVQLPLVNNMLSSLSTLEANNTPGAKVMLSRLQGLMQAVQNRARLLAGDRTGHDTGVETWTTRDIIDALAASAPTDESKLAISLLEAGIPLSSPNMPNVAQIVAGKKLVNDTVVKVFSSSLLHTPSESEAFNTAAPVIQRDTQYLTGDALTQTEDRHRAIHGDGAVLPSNVRLALGKRNRGKRERGHRPTFYAHTTDAVSYIKALYQHARARSKATAEALSKFDIRTYDGGTLTAEALEQIPFDDLIDISTGQFLTQEIQPSIADARVWQTPGSVNFSSRSPGGTYVMHPAWRYSEDVDTTGAPKVAMNATQKEVSSIDNDADMDHVGRYKPYGGRITPMLYPVLGPDGRPTVERAWLDMDLPTDTGTLFTSGLLADQLKWEPEEAANASKESWFMTGSYRNDGGTLSVELESPSGRRAASTHPAVVAQWKELQRIAESNTVTDIQLIASYNMPERSATTSIDAKQMHQMVTVPVSPYEDQLVQDALARLDKQMFDPGNVESLQHAFMVAHEGASRGAAVNWKNLVAAMHQMGASVSIPGIGSPTVDKLTSELTRQVNALSAEGILFYRSTHDEKTRKRRQAVVDLLLNIQAELTNPYSSGALPGYNEVRVDVPRTLSFNQLTATELFHVMYALEWHVSIQVDNDGTPSAGFYGATPELIPFILYAIASHRYQTREDIGEFQSQVSRWAKSKWATDYTFAVRAFDDPRYSEEAKRAMIQVEKLEPHDEVKPNEVRGKLQLGRRTEEALDTGTQELDGAAIAADLAAPAKELAADTTVRSKRKPVATGASEEQMSVGSEYEGPSDMRRLTRQDFIIGYLVRQGHSPESYWSAYHISQGFRPIQDQLLKLATVLGEHAPIDHPAQVRDRVSIYENALRALDNPPKLVDLFTPPTLENLATVPGGMYRRPKAFMRLDRRKAFGPMALDTFKLRTVTAAQPFGHVMTSQAIMQLVEDHMTRLNKEYFREGQEDTSRVRLTNDTSKGGINDAFLIPRDLMDTWAVTSRQYSRTPKERIQIMYDMVQNTLYSATLTSMVPAPDILNLMQSYADQLYTGLAAIKPGTADYAYVQLKAPLNEGNINSMFNYVAVEVWKAIQQLAAAKVESPAAGNMLFRLIQPQITQKPGVPEMHLSISPRGNTVVAKAWRLANAQGNHFTSNPSQLNEAWKAMDSLVADIKALTGSDYITMRVSYMNKSWNTNEKDPGFTKRAKFDGRKVNVPISMIPWLIQIADTLHEDMGTTNMTPRSGQSLAPLMSPRMMKQVNAEWERLGTVLTNGNNALAPQASTFYVEPVSKPVQPEGYAQPIPYNPALPAVRHVQTGEVKQSRLQTLLLGSLLPGGWTGANTQTFQGVGGYSKAKEERLETSLGRNAADIGKQYAAFGRSPLWLPFTVDDDVLAYAKQLAAENKHHQGVTEAVEQSIRHTTRSGKKVEKAALPPKLTGEMTASLQDFPYEGSATETAHKIKLPPVGEAGDFDDLLDRVAWFHAGMEISSADVATKSQATVLDDLVFLKKEWRSNNKKLIAALSDAWSAPQEFRFNATLEVLDPRNQLSLAMNPNARSEAIRWVLNQADTQTQRHLAHVHAGILEFMPNLAASHHAALFEPVANGYRPIDAMDPDLREQIERRYTKNPPLGTQEVSASLANSEAYFDTYILPVIAAQTYAGSVYAALDKEVRNSNALKAEAEFTHQRILRQWGIYDSPDRDGNSPIQRATKKRYEEYDVTQAVVPDGAALGPETTHYHRTYGPLGRMFRSNKFMTAGSLDKSEVQLVNIVLDAASAIISNVTELATTTDRTRLLKNSVKTARWFTGISVDRKEDLQRILPAELYTEFMAHVDPILQRHATSSTSATEELVSSGFLAIGPKKGDVSKEHAVWTIPVRLIEDVLSGREADAATGTTALPMSSAKQKLVAAGRDASELTTLHAAGIVDAQNRKLAANINSRASTWLLNSYDSEYINMRANLAPGFTGPGFRGVYRQEIHMQFLKSLLQLKKADVSGDIKKLETEYKALLQPDNKGRITAAARPLGDASVKMLTFLFQLKGKTVAPGTTKDVLIQEIQKGGLRDLGVPSDAQWLDVLTGIHEELYKKLLERQVRQASLPDLQIPIEGVTNPLILYKLVQGQVEDAAAKGYFGRNVATGRGSQMNQVELFNKTGLLPSGEGAHNDMKRYFQEVLSVTTMRILLNQLGQIRDINSGKPMYIMEPVELVGDDGDNEVMLAGFWEHQAEELHRIYKDDPEGKRLTSDTAKSYTRRVIDNIISKRAEYGSADTPLRSVGRIFAIRYELADTNVLDLFSGDKFLSGSESMGMLRHIVPPTNEPYGIFKALRLVDGTLKTLALTLSVFFATAGFESLQAAFGAAGLINDKVLKKLPFINKIPLLGVVGIRAPKDGRVPHFGETYGRLRSGDPSYRTLTQKMVANRHDVSSASAPVDIPYHELDRFWSQSHDWVELHMGKKAADAMREAHRFTRAQTNLLFDSFFKTIKVLFTAKLLREMQEYAVREGRRFNPDTALLEIATISDNAIGGLNTSRVSYLTPHIWKMMGLLLFSPPWTHGAWAVAGGHALTGPLMKMVPEPNESRFYMRNWINMSTYVLFLWPALIQAAAFATAGSDDKDDEPWMWLNEKDKQLYADITPWMRKFAPGYTGGPTEQRRVYIHWGKQAYEVLNGWLEDPGKTVRGKMSRFVTWGIEEMTGGRLSDPNWRLGFDNMGVMGGLFEDQHQQFSGSRAAHTLSFLLPFSVAGLAKSPETAPLSFIGPASQGISFSKAADLYGKMLLTWARTDTYSTVYKNPRVKANLESLAPEILKAAERNGIKPIDVIDAARSGVMLQLYGEFYKALDANDERRMDDLAKQILRVHGTIDNVLKSVGGRDRKNLRVRSEEELDLIRQAFEIGN